MRDFAPHHRTARDQANRPTLVASILLFRGLELFFFLLGAIGVLSATRPTNLQSNAQARTDAKQGPNKTEC